MEEEWLTREIRVRGNALQLLASNVGGTNYEFTPRQVYPSKLIGKRAQNAISDAVEYVLTNAGFANQKVKQWHILRNDPQTSTVANVQDLSFDDESTAMCVLLSIGVAGQLTVSRISSAKKTQKQTVDLKNNTCFIYRCSTIYSLGKSAMYLHCTCAPEEVLPQVMVCYPVKFACPYKKALALGELRISSRRFVANTAGACEYSGLRRKHVMHHVDICSFNPSTNGSHTIGVDRPRRKRRLAPVEINDTTDSDSPLESFNR